MIRTPVIYEPRSKTIYQANGYGIVCKVDEFTHDADESIGQPEYDALCNEVGEQIANALNTAAADREKLEAAEAKLERIEKELREIAKTPDTREGHYAKWLLDREFGEMESNGSDT